MTKSVFSYVEELCSVFHFSIFVPNGITFFSDCLVGFTSCEEKEMEHAPSIFGLRQQYRSHVMVSVQKEWYLPRSNVSLYVH